MNYDVITYPKVFSQHSLIHKPNSARGDYGGKGKSPGMAKTQTVHRYFRLKPDREGLGIFS